MRSPAWHAELHLGFTRRDGRTLLSERRHIGPLRVQKALYPEDEAVCHAIVVHPPAGIAGGDSLQVSVAGGTAAHALLTSPGAAKWYRSGGTAAAQEIRLDVGPHGRLEWLPQESIVFDGAEARMATRVHLDATARACGWEILVLGRTAADERFASGELRQHTEVFRDGRLLWRERAVIPGGSPLLDSLVGLQGRPVLGTFWLATPDGQGEDAFNADLLPSIRAAAPGAAITRLPGVLLARCLGDSAIGVRETLTRVWHALREPVFGQPAMTPRIWQT
jgi:urease accessory protein